MKLNLLFTQFSITVAHDRNTENKNENGGGGKKMKKRRVGKNTQKASNETENEKIKPNCCNNILKQTGLYF